MKRLIRTKEVLWIIATLGLVATIGRFAFGLGAATALSDQLPWGMWKVMNMIAGAALSTSGFVMAFLVVVARINSLKPLLRPAILIAFLGYGSSCFALLLDIGLPWRFYYPFIHWNIHSFLFEVTLCVTFYFTITAVEMVPIITERTRWRNAGHFIHKYILPTAIVGITLSSLHHTSLGALFLTSPERLHPIWYSPWINWMFIISAMGGGLMTLTLVTLIVGKLYGRKTDLRLLGGVSALGVFLLAVYGMAKALDLSARGQWGAVFSGDWEGAVFIVECALLIVIPAVLVLWGRSRRSAAGLAILSFSAVAGVALNRIDSGIIGFFRSAGAVYIPSFPELCIGFGVLAAAGLVFLFAIENFEVYEKAPFLPLDAAVRKTSEEFDPVSGVWENVLANPVHRYSMAVIIGLVAAVGLFSGDALQGMPLISKPVLAPLGADSTRSVLIIDGDRDGMGVSFKHDFHKTKLGGDGSCGKCHHLDKPNDMFTACYKCHSDMTLDTDIFDHSVHTRKNGGNDSCTNCHTDPAKARWENNAKACHECHEKDMRMSAPASGSRFNSRAPSYADAMHGMCLNCHREMDLSHKTNKSLEECSACHGSMRPGRPR